ncbi:hypothetical protein U6B65_03605 [Oscillospiraceae bacterium MB08-C2-2]|nr:hypothetical protein U6B65_03605 [Oscillospiraceae bacterium MB08-C2-2]
MYITLLLLLALLSSLAFFANQRKGSPLMFAVAGDEDIKIAPESFSSPFPREDTAERAARQYMRQRETGNIDKARKLGATFAKGILEGTIISRDAELDAPDYTQQVLLYSYVVNLVIQHRSPNSILSQTALNVFYEILEESSKELYAIISDMASFSFYILCERTHASSEECVGDVFAKLASRPGEEFYIERGNSLYQRFYKYCLKELEQVDYILD